MYVKQNCHILFYRKLKKKNADGLVPLYARLTIDGIIDELSTGIRINPDHWDQKEQAFTKDDPDRQAHDDEVARIRTDLKRHFDLIQVQHEVAMPEMVIRAYNTALRAQKTHDEQVENFAFSETLDRLISRYLIYDRYEKAHDWRFPRRRPRSSCSLMNAKA
jgi:hypothetical protein